MSCIWKIISIYYNNFLKNIQKFICMKKIFLAKRHVVLFKITPLAHLILFAPTQGEENTNNGESASLIMDSLT